MHIIRHLSKRFPHRSDSKKTNIISHYNSATQLGIPPGRCLTSPSDLGSENLYGVKHLSTFSRRKSYLRNTHCLPFCQCSSERHYIFKNKKLLTEKPQSKRNGDDLERRRQKQDYHAHCQKGTHPKVTSYPSCCNKIVKLFQSISILKPKPESCKP